MSDVSNAKSGAPLDSAAIAIGVTWWWFWVSNAIMLPFVILRFCKCCAARIDFKRISLFVNSIPLLWLIYIKKIIIIN